jgi:hypothetical protein
MSFWVYYNDLGGNGPESGIEQFVSGEEAARFIDRRIAECRKPELRNYIVIRGDQLTVEVVEVISKVLIEGQPPAVQTQPRETKRGR